MMRRSGKAAAIGRRFCQALRARWTLQLAARRQRCVCRLEFRLESDGLSACSVIASAAKQSRVFPQRDLDCFAALAMTPR
ncbi:hypothetical protein XH98_31680 [Bradyrhizobium sp. CCBAU 51745]|nr:hypothetical protein [Bradyrhizobium sp. CCBAU 51745]